MKRTSLSGAAGLQAGWSCAWPALALALAVTPAAAMPGAAASHASTGLAAASAAGRAPAARPASSVGLGTTAAPAAAVLPAAAGLPPAGGALAGSTSPRPAGAALGCLIEASAVAEVGTAVIGIIEDVLVERGDLVKRGQPMAQHESRVERAAVLLAQQKVANTAELRAAKSQISFANRKAERTATLTELNFVSGQAREQADTEATMARMRLAQAEEQRKLALKELDLARAQLQQRTIVSPLTGVVVDRLVSPGERVENRPVFKVAQIDPLRVEVVLPSAMFGRIAAGAVARVQPDLPGSATHEARVSIVDRVVDAGSNTFRARLSLPNPTQQLPAGVRCRIEFGG